MDTTIKELFFQPYLRIFVQQLIAILGGFLFMVLSGAKGIAVLVIVLKTFVDLMGISMKSNKKFKEKVIQFMMGKNEKDLSNEEKENQRKLIEKMFE